jgi:hypothetical protein
MATMNKVVQLVFDQKNGVPDIYITSKWGYRTINGKTSFHYGTDYGTNVKNLPMYAIEDGEVTGCGYEASGAGYWIRIYYKRLGVWIAYFHMKAATTLKTGQKVTRGTLCGYTGTTGNSTGIHLHLEVRDASYTRVDPEVWGAKYDGGGVGNPVNKDTSHDQINITINNLNVRSAPGLKAAILGFAKTGYYYYDNLPPVEMDGYTWYNIQSGAWVAGVNGVEVYPAAKPPVIEPPTSGGDNTGSTDTSELEKNVATLRADFDKMTEFIAALQDGIATASNATNSRVSKLESWREYKN